MSENFVLSVLCHFNYLSLCIRHLVDENKDFGDCFIQILRDFIAQIKFGEHFYQILVLFYRHAVFFGKLYHLARLLALACG